MGLIDLDRDTRSTLRLNVGPRGVAAVSVGPAPNYDHNILIYELGKLSRCHSE